MFNRYSGDDIFGNALDALDENQNQTAPPERSTSSATQNPSRVFETKLTSILIPSATPWDHSAISTRSGQYLSAHPATHFNPPQEDFREEDLPNTLRAVFGSIATMIHSGLVFESKEELAIPHQEVSIPVTEDEHDRAVSLMERVKEEGRRGLMHYSIFGSLGKSCSSAHHDVLQEITRDTPEQALSQLSRIERMTGIVWPQWEAERAQKIAEARQADVSNRVIMG